MMMGTCPGCDAYAAILDHNLLEIERLRTMLVDGHLADEERSETRRIAKADVQRMVIAYNESLESYKDVLTIRVKRSDAEWWIYEGGGYGPVLEALTQALEEQR
jgi:hypothetical protein